MNPSRPFILRPVATTLLMIAIMLTGFLAWRLLPVSALPEVDYPTIQVVTLYPGASPDVMTSSVTAPLERQFGQMPGLSQMSSSSSGGASVITLQFSLDLTLDVAESPSCFLLFQLLTKSSQTCCQSKHRIASEGHLPSPAEKVRPASHFKLG